jgi:ABC-2 type transport system permease protein
MSRMLSAELIKLRTTRTFAALVGAAAGLSLLLTVLVTLLQNDWQQNDVQALFANANVTSLFIVLLGAIGMAGEWRHRTITSTVLAAPQRLKLLLAKVLAYAVAGLVLSLIVNLAVIAVGTLILSVRDLPTLGVSDLADLLWRNLAIAALLGAIGVCVGALLRNAAAATVLLLVLLFVVEPLVFNLAPDVGKWGPLNTLPTGVQNAVGVDNKDDYAGPLAALLGMFAWVGVLFAAAAATFTRRDLT